VKLAIGRNTAEIESELKRLKLIASTHYNTGSDTTLGSSNIFSKLLEKLPFTRYYCQDKLFVDSRKEFSWWEEGLFYEDEPISLTKSSNADITCY
jgi:hypothetical protein